jgi:hypothetical protein
MFIEPRAMVTGRIDPVDESGRPALPVPLRELCKSVDTRRNLAS